MKLYSSISVELLFFFQSIDNAIGFPTQFRLLALNEAFGCTISGAGPTSVAVTDDEEKGREIGERMVEAFMKEETMARGPFVLHLARSPFVDSSSSWSFCSSFLFHSSSLGTGKETEETHLLSQLSDACLVVDALEPLVREELVKNFCSRELTLYQQN